MGKRATTKHKPKYALNIVVYDRQLISKSQTPSFPELDSAIEEAISTLGGSVCIKLNWSTPTDAVWVSGTLKCETAGDVYLLLKSSDRIAFDLEHMCAAGCLPAICY